MSDPLFERSHHGEYYALYFGIVISSDQANNYEYRTIFDRFPSTF